MRVLMSSIIAASDVDLPEPVLPVTRIRPLLTRQRLRTTSGMFELLERQRFRRDRAEDRAEAADVPEDVDAEARNARDRVGEVGAVLLLEAAACARAS